MCYYSCEVISHSSINRAHNDINNLENDEFSMVKFYFCYGSKTTPNNPNNKEKSVFRHPKACPDDWLISHFKFPRANLLKLWAELVPLHIFTHQIGVVFILLDSVRTSCVIYEWLRPLQRYIILILLVFWAYCNPFLLFLNPFYFFYFNFQLSGFKEKKFLFLHSTIIGAPYI